MLKIGDFLRITDFQVPSSFFDRHISNLLRIIDLSVSTGFYRFLQVSTGFYRFLQVSTGFYRFLQVSTVNKRMFFQYSILTPDIATNLDKLRALFEAFRSASSVAL